MSEQLLNTILSEVLAMRGDFARFIEEQRGHGDDQSGALPNTCVSNTYAALMAAIVREFGNEIFTTKELVERMNWGGSGPLILALTNAGATNARKLGKLLTKIEKLNLPDVYVERAGHQSLGILGAVRQRS